MHWSQVSLRQLPPSVLLSPPSWLALTLMVARSRSRWVAGAFAVIIKHHWFNERNV